MCATISGRAAASLTVSQQERYDLEKSNQTRAMVTHLWIKR
jgi:hypothetical protein